MSSIIKSSRVNYIDDFSKTSQAPREAGPEVGDKPSLKPEKIIKEALEEARRILAKAEYKASKMRKDLDHEVVVARKAAENLGFKEGKTIGYEAGYEEGYNEGYQKGHDEAQKITSDILDHKEDYLNKKKSLLKDSEKDLIELVIGIYEKVLDKEMENPDYIIDLILSGLRRLDPMDCLNVIISREDYKKVLENKDRLLLEASLIEDLDIKYDVNLKRGDCILETPMGDIDLSIRSQIDGINKTLKKILNNE